METDKSNGACNKIHNLYFYFEIILIARFTFLDYTVNVYNMTKIFIFFFIASVITVFSGRFLLKFLKYDFKKNFLSKSEQGFFGLILLSFICLLINFFYKIDEIIASVILLIPISQIVIESKSMTKKSFTSILYHSIIVAIISTLLISFDNVNRPDAGAYHLPYTKIINDFKIFIGITTLNPLFGVTSIFQYTSAIYNNFIFKDVGITIPMALLSIYFIDYILREFLINKNNKIYYRFFLFFIASYFFLEMNRYSEYGNDIPGHILIFYITTILLRDDFNLKKPVEFKLLCLLCLFTFLNKLFFILILFLPFIVFVKYQYYKKINFYPFFSVFFLALWVIKNIYISGCLIYPVSFTCNSKLDWYSDKPEFIISSKNLSQFSELHAKGWRDITLKNKFINYKENYEKKKIFSRNFNWLNSKFSTPNMKYGFYKIFDIFSILLLLFTISLFFISKENKKKRIKFNKNSFRFNIFILICTFSVGILIYKYPLGRYGAGYLIILITLVYFFIFKKLLLKAKEKNLYQTMILLLSICAFSFFIKNTIRIVSNYDTKFYQSPWPRIYNNQEELNQTNERSNYPVNFKKINKNGLLNVYFISNDSYWRPDKREILCMYNKSPCTQTSKNFETFDLIKTKYSYYLIKLRK